MQTHKISVTVGNGSIQVDPETLRMKSDHEVHWAGTGAQKFSIEFDGASPLTDRKLSHAVATQKHRPRAAGRFKYTVISEADPKVRLDPVIIVDEPGTGTGK